MDADDLQAQRRGLQLIEAFALVPPLKKQVEKLEAEVQTLSRQVERLSDRQEMVLATLKKIEPVIPELENRKKFFESLDKAKNYALGALIFYAFFGEDVSKVIIAKLLGVS